MVENTEISIRIVVLTPYPLVRAGMKRLIDDCLDLQVVAEGEASDEILETVAAQQPDIILLELVPGSTPGLEFVPALLKAYRQARVILITPKCEENYYLQALQEGVIGVVFKTQPLELLIKAIRKVHAGEAWIDHSMVAALLVNISSSQPAPPTDPEAERYGSLNPREREIVQMVGQGLKQSKLQPGCSSARQPCAIT